MEQPVDPHTERKGQGGINSSIQSSLDDVHENGENQLAVYDPCVNDASEIVPTTDQSQSTPPTMERALPSVGAFTVQCASCFKWRLIPTKDKYEEIREHILECPFFCETAREWKPEVSCDDPPDITQDDSRLWAIDKPSIAQPPPGWERLLRIRGEGSSKFADVYYVAPSGKKLRSMVEIQKYLEVHPEYVAEGAKLSKFSFQIPRPLQQSYLKKRSHRSTPSHNDTASQIAANPIAWVGPDEEEDTNLQLGGPGLSVNLNTTPVSEHLSSSMKKRRTTSK